MTTTTSSRRIRRGAGVAAAVAALAVAGCGGGGGGGSSKKDYQSSLNTFCTSVKSAASQVQKDATSIQGSAAKNPQSAVKALSGALGKFADSTQTAIDKLKGADPPGAYKDFHDKAVAAFESVVGKLRQAASAAKTGNVQAITALGTSLNSIKLPDIPSDLKSKAPACSDIAAS